MAPNDSGSDNELDAFDSKREQILLDAAGDYAHESSAADDSDEEVMGLHALSESGEEADAFEAVSEEDAEDEDNWGSKRNYYGGDDASDDDAGMAEEALRQQKKHLQELHMDDFVDEDMMGEWKKTAAQYEAPAAPAADAVVDFFALDDDDKRKHLSGSFPEFAPLVGELAALQPQLAGLQRAAGPVARAQFVALSAYLSSISSYVSMFVEQLATRAAFSMKDSPVMESILGAREVWRQARELRAAKAAPEAGDRDDDARAGESAGDASDGAAAVSDTDSGAEAAELATDSESEDAAGDDDDDDDDESSGEDDIELNPLAKRTIKTAGPGAANDFTEAATPDSIDVDEKRRRRKTLRFYTSKIDQAAQKNARNEKFDGDSDLPYRERLFERQQRLVEEARKRGLGQDKAALGDALDGAEGGSGDEQAAQDVNGAAVEYYEQVRHAKSAKKDARQTAHKLATKAAKEGKLAQLQEALGEDGKRALNFQIQKNKGLTPNRRNDNRNARVKKRKKYEDAKKKLRSVRQVYDQNRGPYEGEKTGIKKSVSRSVKFA